MGTGARTAWWAVGGLAALTGSTLVAVNTSPRWATALIRVAFERAGAAMATRMRRHVPAGVVSRTGIPYRPGDPDATLTVHRRAEVPAASPVLVWVHGGGWVSGHGSHVDPYLEIIAARADVVTVSVEYTRGPKAVHPTALRQIDAALAHLVEHADELGLDPRRIVLAGDSAGAQLATESAALVTNPAFAALAGVRPALEPAQLRGMLLHCGVYDLAGLVHAPGAIGWAVGQVIWAYTGVRSPVDNAALTSMTAADAVTAQFPPTLIAGGNGDPLTRYQSRPFADRLAALGVPVEAHFYPDDHVPKLPHEFQFDLDGADGQALLERTLEWLDDRFRP
ncbi:alpha/beta hydrolase [Nakamurella deserti]|uniref:alpha/beta hydrolase n=1 Tax=Nakamurella deserti TaxID=2164074 RepID=UPI000DBE6083|nr:alpha/beta hydrolase fold domain-containing protein [Nakamurella deserti]